MRCDAVNMLNHAAKAIGKEGRRFGYDYSLEQLAEHLAGVRDGRHSWDEFAEFYCLTERDRELNPADVEAVK